MFAQSSLKDRDFAQVTLALAPNHKEGIAMIFAQMADSDKGWSAFDHFETSHLALFSKTLPLKGNFRTPLSRFGFLPSRNDRESASPVVRCGTASQ